MYTNEAKSVSFQTAKEVLELLDFNALKRFLHVSLNVVIATDDHRMCSSLTVTSL